MSPLAWQALVLAKAPVPGRVKTRLCPPLSPEEAADLAAAALADTMVAVGRSSARRRVLVVDGDPTGVVPPGCDHLSQRPGDLGARLAGAFEDAYATSPLPMVLVGMDTPQLTPHLLEEAAAALASGGTDAVVGPAADGGFWLLGLRQPVPGLFDGVPMSRATTGEALSGRLAHLGLRWRVGPVRRDVDELDDAVAVAHVAPDTQFAAAFAAIRSRHVAGVGAFDE
ncbi:MAG TPA: TIGR04282 family arsenosugar biosynthesis glycosyltransferase [Acidimicrobiales bacterium]|nr:TIGR04282 family arsenosugar biosynthesis glycosyltransferase [Acidimicrobiales bacterium]